MKSELMNGSSLDMGPTILVKRAKQTHTATLTFSEMEACHGLTGDDTWANMRRVLLTKGIPAYKLAGASTVKETQTDFGVELEFA